MPPLRKRRNALEGITDEMLAKYIEPEPNPHGNGYIVTCAEEWCSEWYFVTPSDVKKGACVMIASKLPNMIGIKIPTLDNAASWNEDELVTPNRSRGAAHVRSGDTIYDQRYVS